MPMPMPKPNTRLVFILVPITGRLEWSVHAAKAACRIALQSSYQPMCPLLYYLTFLSPGELEQARRPLFMKWLPRTDRIWLQFPAEDETLDTLSYDILDGNRRSSRRKPVYQLHTAGDDFVPAPMRPDEIQELLAINITSGLASCL